MKKLKKDDYKNIALILFLIIIYVLCITNFLNSFYGSTVDWDCQHFLYQIILESCFMKLEI